MDAYRQGWLRTWDSAIGSLRNWRMLIEDIQRVELALVRRQAHIGRRGWVRPFALVLNHLGNGWLYPLLIVVLLWLSPEDFLVVLVSAGAAAGVAHLVYPAIKRWVARLRPFEVDPAMPPLLRTMDRYSFPSGHCMTITAVAIPVAVTHPALSLPAVLTCLLIGWARMLAAHHYPSDILAGTALGALAALPATLALL
jgi:undecaprenyl-diphosphatase